MNRETKRLMQRQGQVDRDGEPIAAQRPVATSRPVKSATKRGFFGRIKAIISYLGEVRTELRKVAWPTKLEVRNYSIVVLITLVILIALIFFLDLAFSAAAVFLFK